MLRSTHIDTLECPRAAELGACGSGRRKRAGRDAAKRYVISLAAALACILLCERGTAIAASRRTYLSAPTPLAALHAGDRFRFRVDVSHVITQLDISIVEGTRTNLVGAPEHRQLDVLVEVISADSTGIVTRETFVRVFDDSSSCDPWPWPSDRIDGVSFNNRFDRNGNFLGRVALTDDSELAEIAGWLAPGPVFDIGYLPPFQVKPGDSWTREATSGADGQWRQVSEYTLYPAGPCVHGLRCLMLTLDLNDWASGEHAMHGQYDIVADEDGMLVSMSGGVSNDAKEYESVTATRESIARIGGPSPRPSWMPDDFGKLRVVLMPWALVWVDGRLNAREVQTPFCVRLPSGRHTIRLVNEYLARDEIIEVVIGAGESIVIFRNWCRHLVSGPGCMAELDDNDRLRDLVRDDVAKGEVQRMLEPAGP